MVYAKNKMFCKVLEWEGTFSEDLPAKRCQKRCTMLKAPDVRI